MEISNDSGLFNLRTISDFSIGDRSISISFSYPLIALVSTSTEITIFDLEKQESKQIHRKNANYNSTPLCSAISDDHNFIATGHVCDEGGEVVIWSIQNETEDISLHVSEGVDKISFGQSSSMIIFSDLMNVLYGGTITKNMFFQKSLHLFQINQYQEHITYIDKFKNYIVVGTLAGVVCYDNTSGYKIKFLWENNLPVSYFNFYQDDKNMNYVACLSKCDVFLISLNDGKNLRKFCFLESFSPKLISLPNTKNVIGIFNKYCEFIDLDKNVFKCELPSGIVTVNLDKVFIFGNKVYELSLASIEQRIKNYIKDGNWDSVFTQIKSKDDIDNLDELLNKYIESDKFNIKFLFTIVEKYNYTDFIINMKFKCKEYEILNEFFENPISNWKLSFNFIKKIIISFHDSQKLESFIDKIDLNFIWYERLLSLLIDYGLYNIIQSFSYKYQKNVYLTLIIAHFQNDFESVYSILYDLLITKESDFDGCISYLMNSNLKPLVSYNEEKAKEIFLKTISLFNKSGMPLNGLMNQIISGIDKDSSIWIDIVPIIIEQKIMISHSLESNLDLFIFYRTSPVYDLQNDLLLMLIRTSQFTNLSKYFKLARKFEYLNPEFEIISLMHNVDELIIFLIKYQIKTFHTYISRVINNQLQLKNTLKTKSKILLAINSKEYCDELCNLGDYNLIHEVTSNFSNDDAFNWHLLSRLFEHQEFYENATNDEIICYINLLSKYHPLNVYSTLKLFPELPLNDILQICQSYNIVDATLYLCDLTHNSELALQFCLDILESSLIECNDSLVVSQICNYLSTSYIEDKEHYWFKFFETFQLPIFYFLKKKEEEKLERILEILKQFLDSMIQNLDSISVITEKFVDIFSFVPMKYSRNLILYLFKSIREKNEFSSTLLQIEKSEAANIQLNRIEDLSRGHEYDGTRCENCLKLLGQNDVVALPCGHVCHLQCYKSGWCHMCQHYMNKSETPQLEDQEIKYQIFDSVEEQNDEKQILDLWKNPEDNDDNYVPTTFHPSIGNVTQLY